MFSENTGPAFPFHGRSEVLEKITGLIGGLLDVAAVGGDDDFSEIGVSSLDIIRFAVRLEDVFGFRPEMEDFLQMSTPNKLCDFYVSRALGTEPERDAGGEKIRLMEEDALLDPAWRPRPASTAGAAVRNVFLTGATGFLGAFLLKELLSETDAVVHCLVRASGAGQARERLRENLRYYGLDDAYLSERIVPVVGRLDRADLGLSRAGFEALGGQLDLILHAGAEVNFVFPYARLRGANVEGTRRMIELSWLGGDVPVHFVSTYGVLVSPPYLALPVVDEETPLNHHDALANGYDETKWVGERIVDAAGRRGFRVQISRPGLISGDSRTGIGNRHPDILFLIILGSLQMKAAPVLDFELDLTPVDYVSRSIVRLALNRGLDRRAFHLINPRRNTASEIVGWLKGLGHEFEQVPFEDWLKRLDGLGPENVLFPLVPFLQSVRTADRLRIPRIESAKTAAALPAASSCPVPDRELFARYMSRFAARGLAKQVRGESAV